MKEFGGVSRRDSELRDAVVRRIKRRRQWQVAQGTHAKVAQRWTVHQRASAPVKPVGLPTKTEERQDGAGQSSVYSGCDCDGPRVEAGENQQVKGIAGRMDKDRVVFFRSWGNGHRGCRASLANRQKAGLPRARGPSPTVLCLLRPYLQHAGGLLRTHPVPVPVTLGVTRTARPGVGKAANLETVDGCNCAANLRCTTQSTYNSSLD